MEAAKVSFTVRRPTPVSRAASSGPDSDAGSSFKVPTLPRHLLDESTPLGSPLARSSAPSPRPKSSQKHRNYHEEDSSDEDNVMEDELVTGFDKFGVQRLNGERKKADKPLVIPALKNKDWREQARKRKALQYVPPSAAAATGADGSVGGLGTRDSINSGPMLSGLQIHRKGAENLEEETRDEQGDVQMTTEEELSEDQRALRALLAEAGGEMQHDGPVIDIIPAPVSETDALKQDVEELPDEATLDDYARVPVSQFGAALLRGMGWKEGTAATRKPGKGLVEPYLPTSRPALLGIGAKEQEVLDDGSKQKKSKYVDKRYVPIIKQERTGSSSSTSRDRRDRSRSPRRDTSRRNSPDRYGTRKDRDGDSDSRKGRYDDDGRRDRDREGDRDRSRRYDSDSRRSDDRDKRSDGDRRKDRERESERDPRDRDRTHSDKKRTESSRRKDY